MIQFSGQRQNQNQGRVELHRHLDCSMRPATLKELLIQAGEVSPTISEAEFRTRYLIESPMTDLKSVLLKFLASKRALSSKANLKRLTMECIEDAHRDGADLIELRFAPTFICEDQDQLNFDRVLESIVEGIHASQHLGLRVGLIATIQRIKSVTVATQVLDFVLANRTEFVGLDLADQEEGFDVGPFENVFERARSHSLGITVHAGESPSPHASQRIRDAVDRLGATRIGHGVQCIHDRALIDWLIEHNIHLELCPTSNVLTQAVQSVAQHPIRRLFDAGVSVSINTDDPGIFNISLEHEYSCLRQHLGFDDKDFRRINQMARQASFLPPSMRTT